MKLFNSLDRVDDREFTELVRLGFRELYALGKPNKLLIALSLILEDTASGHQRLARVLREVCKTGCHDASWIKYLDTLKPSYSSLTFIRNLMDSPLDLIAEGLLVKLINSLECDELSSLRNEGYLEAQPSLIKHYINAVLNVRKCDSLVTDALGLLSDSILYDLIKYEDVRDILKESRLRLIIKRKDGVYNGVDIYYNDVKVNAADLNVLGFIKLYHQLSASQALQ